MYQNIGTIGQDGELTGTLKPHLKAGDMIATVELRIVGNLDLSRLAFPNSLDLWDEKYPEEYKDSVVGVVRGHLAIHRHRHGHTYWAVTHAPSGLGVGPCKFADPGDAFELVDELLRLWDWSEDLREASPGQLAQIRETIARASN